jgi:hypothetical protein
MFRCARLPRFNPQLNAFVIHMVTLGRSARILQQPQRALRLAIVACSLCVACSVSSCAAPADSAGSNSAGNHVSEKTGSSVAVPPVSGGESVPQEPAPVESPGVGGREAAPHTSFDSSGPLRASGGREETVVVSAPKPQAAAPSAPADATVVEAPEPPPAKQPSEVASGPPAKQPSEVASGPPAKQPSEVASGPPAKQPSEVASRPPAVQATPQPARPVYDGPVSGKLTCNGAPVIQNGEVVFGGLPPGRLQIAYDTAAWDARIRPDEHNTQKVVLRNKRPGVQRSCTVTWQLIE